MTSAALIAALAVVCVGFGVVAARFARRIRLAAGVVQLLTARLDPESAGTSMASMEQALVQLERAVTACRRRTEVSGAAATQLRSALDRLPLGVVLCDERGRPVVRNSAVRAVAGARHSAALVEAAVEDLLGRALSEAEASERVLELFGPPRRVVHVTAMPVRSFGADGDGGLAIVEDVTERVHLQAVRTDFVANISHELKTPVGALGLLAETLVAEEDPEVRLRLGNRIVAEAQRVGRTIDDLLDLSRIEADPHPERHRVDVAALVADVVERSRPSAASRGIEIELGPVPPDLAVLGDVRQLASALGNLLENAVKYSDAGATIAVTTEARDGVAAIAVRDSGIGIPARDLERIFERFYRVDRARSRDTGGTGLGLAIVRHVATNHGGDVAVESVEGEGSTFTLRLPAAAFPAEAPPGAPAGPGVPPLRAKVERTAAMAATEAG